MRGADTIRQDLRETFRASVRLEDVAAILRTARSQTELLALWDHYAECERGEVREALQEVYGEMVVKFAPGLSG